MKATFDATGVATLTGEDGKDTLKNIEFVHFSDGMMLPLSALAPPAPMVSTYAAATIAQFITDGNPSSGEMNVGTEAAQSFGYRPRMTASGISPRSGDAGFVESGLSLQLF